MQKLLLIITDLFDVLRTTAKYILDYNGNLSTSEISEKEDKILRRVN